MTYPDPPVEAVADIRELNKLFLDFLRELPRPAAERLGLSRRAIETLQAAPDEQIALAASFPRALFSLCLPAESPGLVAAPAERETSSREHVLRLVLLHSARNLSRMSGYWARLLLRLADDEVNRLRVAEVDEIVAVSRVEGVVRPAFVALDWLWRELLTESRPEYRRRLLLIGFQPEVSLEPALGMA